MQYIHVVIDSNSYRLSFPYVSKLVAISTLLVIGLTTNAYAQVVASRNAPGAQQPTTLFTASGLPQVNIQTPSANGVSHNIYSQFDVQSKGIILNNSSKNVQTKQAGWIQGNPWLSTGSARLILNEVNSANPSYLSGYVEVAGQRAEVVIANPSGISVNGGGFINTSKATLTTGVPIVNNGNLDGYRVQGGHVVISGNGLDLSTTDYAAILARAVEVNAGIWANELKLITGTNQIDASSLNANTSPVVTTIEGTANRPSFALDVAQIGGMYAGKIHLVGTELGLGVRSAGTISASAGDLVLQNNGWLTSTGRLQANGNLKISVQDNFTNSGQVLSNQDTNIHAGGDFTNSGKLQTSGALTLSVTSADNDELGEIASNSSEMNIVNSLINRGLVNGVKTQINANTVNNMGTGRIFSDHLSIASVKLTNDIEVRNGETVAPVIAARDRLDLAIQDTLLNREHALIFSGGNMFIGGSLDANGNAIGSATQINNKSATIEAIGDLSLSTKLLNNTNEHFSSRVDQVSGPNTKSWNVGQYHVDHQTFSYNTIQNEFETKVNCSDPAHILSGGNINLKGDQLINNKSKIIAGVWLTGDLNHLNNIQAIGEHRITESGSVTTTTHYWQGGLFGRGNYWIDQTTEYKPADVVTSITLPVTYTREKASIPSTGNQASVNQQTGASSITNSLFKSNPSLTASYLMETNPSFTDNKRWLSSDYMTQSLDLDPSVTQKRLGDGFYEQKLIREQVAEMTGKRFLADYTSDEQEYKALMNSAITFAQTYKLRPGIALTSQQVALLTSDIVWLEEQSVAMPDGSTQKALVPKLYIKAQSGDLDVRGTLLAGRDIKFNLEGDLTNSGIIAGQNAVSISAENIFNLGGQIKGSDLKLSTQKDLHNMGGNFVASSNLLMNAGRDIDIQSTTQNTQTSMGSRIGIDRLAGLYVSGSNVSTGGGLVANAGRDINIVASVVNNASNGATTLIASKDLNLKSLRTSDQLDIVWNADNYRKSNQSSDIGGYVSGGGSVNLQAGNNLTTMAAKVQAKEALTVDAANRLEVMPGQATTQLEEAYQQINSGLLSNNIISTHEAHSATSVVASSLGGNTITIKAKDIDIKGSSAISDAATSIVAGQSIVIEAANNFSSSSTDRKETSSGLMAGAGLRIGFGHQMQSFDGQSAAITASASTVGSTAGKVQILAGDKYQQVGSDVLAPNGSIDISARAVEISEAREVNKQTVEQSFEQSGMSLGISSVVASTLQNAQNQIKASTQTNDDRLKILAMANAAANAKMAHDARKTDGIEVAFGYGQTSSQSIISSQSDIARVSTLKAGELINIQASGGEDSNLSMQGGQVSGKAINLVADKAVNLLAAQNTNNQISRSENSGSSIGIVSRLGSKDESSGLTASVSKGTSHGEGSETTHTNTHLVGIESVTIQSGSDTVLKGATVEANQIIANVKGNLNIQSLQDTVSYFEKNDQAGVSGILGSNLSGNLNVAKVDIKSNYASVTEQSGIKSGDGGFKVVVQGNTNLLGGAITSTQSAIDNKQNQFQSDGVLVSTDIQNKANYEANSRIVNIGFGSTLLPGQGLSAGMNGVGYGDKNGSADSVSTSGISGLAGDISKRTNDNAQGITPIFLKEQVKSEVTAQTLITQEFGKLASKAIGDYALIKMNEAASVGDPIAMAAWSEGGGARLALHAIVGGLSAGTAGAIGAATSQAAIDPLAQTIKNADLPIELKHTLIAAAGTAVGVVASGGHAAGGVAAFNASDNNYLTHNKLKDELSELNKLKQQRQSETCDVVCIDQIHDLETLDMLRDEKLLPLIATCEKAGRNNCKGEVIAQQFAVVNGLGAESMKRESNPGTLGSPFSFNNCPSIDKGGCSYGPLQIAANTGMMQNFMDSLRNNPSDEAQSFYKELQAAGGVVASKEASPLFIQTWMKLTAKDPQFVQYQIDALINLNLYPLVEELQKVGIDFDNLSRSQKEALFSAAVQHGAGVTAKKIGADNVLERAISVAQTDIQAPSFPTYTRQELVYGQVEDQMRAAEATKANLINQREGTITQREAFITQREGFITQQLQLERQKNQLFEQGFNANADDIVFLQKQIQVLDSKISKINSQVNEKTEKVDKLTQKVEEQEQYIKEAGQYLKAQAQASMANVEQWLKDFYQQRTQMYPSEAKRYQLELDSLLKQYRQEQQGSKK